MKCQGIESKRLYIALLVCLLLNSCSLPEGASKTQHRDAHSPGEQSQDRQIEEPLDPILSALLRQAQQIVKPFAWGAFGGNEERYEVVGIDPEGKLKSIIFTKRAGGYVIERAGTFAEREDALIQSSGSLHLQDLLSDREFPFKSDILTVQDCKVHFVFVWRALNRSFHRRSFLAGIDLRIIVERDLRVVSNELAGLSLFGVREAFVTDINGDGKQDYVFIGEDNSKFIYVWTLERNCVVKPILFQFKDDNRSVTERYVSGRGLFLRADKSTGGYTVHTRSFEPHIKNGTFYWKITESVYKWERRQSLFKKVKESTWLEKSD
ncbi:MAG: hypothetical protein AABN34_28960 [Acidobacteriota bacterium]